MQKWFDSFDTNDREGLSKTVSSDFKVHHPAYKEPLDFDRFYNEIVAGMHQSFTNIKHTVKDRVISGKKAAARGEITMTFSRPYMGMAPNNKEIKMNFMGIGEFNDKGEIKELHMMGDQMALFEQLQPERRDMHHDHSDPNHKH